MFCADVVATGAHVPGGHAEYMPAIADATVLLPEGISYEQAAPIFCAGYTVWSGLRWADPPPHERVAVVGIRGHRLRRQRQDGEVTASTSRARCDTVLDLVREH